MNHYTDLVVRAALILVSVLVLGQYQHFDVIGIGQICYLPVPTLVLVDL